MEGTQNINTSDKEFFEQAYQQEFGQAEPTQEVDNQPEEPKVEDVAETQVQDEPTEIAESNKFTIDGEEYTLEQIKEWKQGNLRQSDYSRKTQELAKQRKEMQEAVELYNYIKQNPDVATALRDADYGSGMEEHTKKLTPEMQKIRDLEYKLAEKELDENITSLKEKYNDFDEVKVMEECDKRGIYDLEFVYKALRDEQPKEDIDIEKIKQDAIEEAKKQILEEMQHNTDSTKTIITEEGASKPVDVSAGDTLTEAEKKYCKKRGFSYAEYAEWKKI